MKSNYIVSWDQIGRATIVGLAGDITFSNVAEVQAEYETIAAGLQIENLVFDVGGVRIADSSGLAVLIDLFRQMKQNGISGRIGLIHLSESMRSLIELAKVGELFSQYPDKEAAFKDLA